MNGLVAKLKNKLGLSDLSIKSQISIPFVLVMKITPGLVGEFLTNNRCFPVDDHCDFCLYLTVCSCWLKLNYESILFRNPEFLYMTQIFSFWAFICLLCVSCTMLWYTNVLDRNSSLYYYQVFLCICHKYEHTLYNVEENLYDIVFSDIWYLFVENRFFCFWLSHFRKLCF